MSKEKKNNECADEQQNKHRHEGDANSTEAHRSASDADTVTDESFEANDKTAVVADPIDEAEMWKDKYMRLSAEFDNYRKRTLREKMELVAAGGEDVIIPLLSVIDDFDRAIEAIGKTTDVAALEQGVTLIRQKLVDTLKAKGVHEVVACGLPLDTDIHDAVVQVKVDDPEKKGKVVEVLQKGYKLTNKVIRHAKVVVGE